MCSSNVYIEVRDDPKLPGDSGKVPFLNAVLAVRFPLWNLLSTWWEKTKTKIKNLCISECCVGDLSPDVKSSLYLMGKRKRKQNKKTSSFPKVVLAVQFPLWNFLSTWWEKTNKKTKNKNSSFPNAVLAVWFPLWNLLFTWWEKKRKTKPQQKKTKKKTCR